MPDCELFQVKKKPTGLCRPWKLSGDLKEVVKVDVASYVQLNRLLWNYIKQNNLQDRQDRRFFYPDQKLQKVCGLGRLRVSKIFSYVRQHLRPVKDDFFPWDKVL